MVGYCLLHVIEGYQKCIAMKYMTVSRTEIGSARAFGSIQTNPERYEELDLLQFAKYGRLFCCKL